MSLGKLLATGRSLVGGPNAARYEVSHRNRLPKFGSSKNPFAPPTPAEPRVSPEETAAMPASPVEPALRPAPQPEPVQASTISPVVEHKKTQVIALERPQPIAATVKPGVRPGWVARGKNWAHAVVALALATFVKLLGILGRLPGRFRRAEQKPILPRFGKPAVQTELSLDNIKVVRSDLEDSDLEIVTAETATSTQVAPSAPVASPKRGPLPPALKKLTGRILGSKPG